MYYRKSKSSRYYLVKIIVKLFHRLKNKIEITFKNNSRENNVQNRISPLVF